MWEWRRCRHDHQSLPLPVSKLYDFQRWRYQWLSNERSVKKHRKFKEVPGCEYGHWWTLRVPATDWWIVLLVIVWMGRTMRPTHHLCSISGHCYCSATANKCQFPTCCFHSRFLSSSSLSLSLSLFPIYLYLFFPILLLLRKTIYTCSQESETGRILRWLLFHVDVQLDPLGPLGIRSWHDTGASCLL